MDLEKIQAQLKGHIRQHQILIEEMKRDPQNVEIQQKVQLLQTELTTLSEKQRQVVQQLKQNIQPRSEVYSRKQEFPTTKQHKMEASCNDVRTDLSIGNRKGKPVSHRPSILAMVGHSKFNPQHGGRMSPPPTTKFIPNITQNNIVHLKEDREAPKKPNMVTTGMQTVPTGKMERIILPRPEAKRPKVSLGIQTSKPVEQPNTGKQNAEKLNFLSTLGLITVSKCREINSQKNERRRRTSAIFSPYSSFQFFDEPKRPSTGIKRGRGRPTKNNDSGLKSPISPSPVFVPINGFKTANHEDPLLNQTPLKSDSSPKDEEHEDHCAVCQQSGEVLMCDTCILVYHLKCLTPPLTSIPSGMWMCPKCQESIKNKEPMEWPGTLAVAHSYLKHRAEKDKEKQKLLNRNQELKLQELELQRKVNELSSAIVTQIQKKTEIVEETRQAQEKLQRLKRFIQAVHSS